MTINFKEIGEGIPIFFIHGNGLNIESMLLAYECCFDGQNENFHRVYIDIPGMGDSDLDETTQNSDDVLNQILAFIKQKVGKKSFLLCGHSYGGSICLGIGARLRKQIKGIFLTCPVVRAKKDDRELEGHMNIVLESVIPKNNLLYFQDFNEMTVIINKRTWTDYQHMIIPGVKKGIHRFWKTINEDAYAFSFEKKLKTDLIGINGTILLGQYDQVVGYRDQLSFFGELSDLRVCVIEDSGHNLAIDQVLVLKKEFAQFLLLNRNSLNDFEVK